MCDTLRDVETTPSSTVDMLVFTAVLSLHKIAGVLYGAASSVSISETICGSAAVERDGQEAGVYMLGRRRTGDR